MIFLAPMAIAYVGVGVTNWLVAGAAAGTAAAVAHKVLKK